MPFPFLDLPPEIREKIYLYTLISPNAIPLTLTSMSFLHPELSNHRLHSLFPYALLLTCHQIYHEVRPLYFSHNSFSLLLIRYPSQLSYFLSPSFRDNRRRIKSLKLVISRWGRGNFFEGELAPMLEDMILNGSLRDLEVWARRQHVFSRGKADELIVREGKVVDRLVGILRDPYLEKVVLKTPAENDQKPGTYLPYKRNDTEALVDAELEDMTRLIKCPK